MSRDSVKQQLFEACEKNRAAAQLLDYLMSVYPMKLKRFPDDPADSSNLWMDFTRAELADKLMVSESTIKRAGAYLAQRKFITIHKPKITDRALRYQLHMSLVETLFQRLPICELADQSEDGHLVTMTKCNWSPRPNASGHHDQMQPVTMTKCYTPPFPSLSPSITTKEYAADEDLSEPTERDRVQAHAVPGAPDGQGEAGEDLERQALLQSCQAIGIAKEHAEAYLTGHSRQKLQAALSCLAIEKRTRLIRNEAGFVIGFLRDPTKYGYELDAQGCWKSSKAIHHESKQRQQAIKARDHPVDPRIAELQAWEQLSYSAQTQIRALIDLAHPDKPAIRRQQLCQERALALTTKEPHEDQNQTPTQEAQVREACQSSP